MSDLHWMVHLYFGIPDKQKRRVRTNYRKQLGSDYDDYRISVQITDLHLIVGYELYVPDDPEHEVMLINITLIPELCLRLGLPHSNLWRISYEQLDLPPELKPPTLTLVT